MVFFLNPENMLLATRVTVTYFFTKKPQKNGQKYFKTCTMEKKNQFHYEGLKKSFKKKIVNCVRGEKQNPNKTKKETKKKMK